jgi:glycolate oxidase
MPTVSYGHAGDGNLHINLLKGENTEEYWQQNVPLAVKAILAFVLEVGGTISGEHGIGWVQVPYMRLAFSEAELTLMHAIKSAWDPQGILNPGKVLPPL